MDVISIPLDRWVLLAPLCTQCYASNLFAHRFSQEPQRAVDSAVSPLCARHSNAWTLKFFLAILTPIPSRDDESNTSMHCKNRFLECVFFF